MGNRRHDPETAPADPDRSCPCWITPSRTRPSSRPSSSFRPCGASAAGAPGSIPVGLRPGVRRRPDRRADPPWRGGAVRRMAVLPHRDVDLAERRAVLRHRQPHDRRPLRRAGRRADGRLRREKVIVGLASAGRVSPALPIPSVVVADSAIRDEGTSYHYLPPADVVRAPGELAESLEAEIRHAGLPVQRGLVWTTDAPYRETAAQIERHARRRCTRRGDAGRVALRLLCPERSPGRIGRPGEQRPGPRRPAVRQGTSRRGPSAAGLHLRGGRQSASRTGRVRTAQRVHRTTSPANGARRVGRRSRFRLSRGAATRPLPLQHRIKKFAPELALEPDVLDEVGLPAHPEPLEQP